MKGGKTKYGKSSNSLRAVPELMPELMPELDNFLMGSYPIWILYLSIKSLRKKHIFCAASKWRCVGWCDEMSVHVSVKRGDCKEIQLTRPLHAAVKLLRPMPWPCDCRYRWQVRQAWLVQACAILGEAFIIKQKYNICQLNFPQFTF